MKHHHQEQEIKDAGIYYLIGLLHGLFIGVILDSGFIWVPILGIVGLLLAAFFVNLLVKGREKA